MSSDRSDIERLECSSLEKVLSAPYRPTRFFPYGSDALNIVNLEIQRRVKILNSSNPVDAHETGECTLEFLTLALKWLVDARNANLLDDCCEDEIEYIAEEWQCIETSLQDKYPQCLELKQC